MATMASITGGAGRLSFLLGIVCGVFLVLIFAELARPFGSAGAVYTHAGLIAGVNFAPIRDRLDLCADDDGALVRDAVCDRRLPSTRR
jgi:hypothetical protein